MNGGESLFYKQRDNKKEAVSKILKQGSRTFKLGICYIFASWRVCCITLKVTFRSPPRRILLRNPSICNKKDFSRWSKW